MVNKVSNKKTRKMSGGSYTKNAVLDDYKNYYKLFINFENLVEDWTPKDTKDTREKFIIDLITNYRYEYEALEKDNYIMPEGITDEDKEHYKFRMLLHIKFNSEGDEFVQRANLHLLPDTEYEKQYKKYSELIKNPEKLEDEMKGDPYLINEVYELLSNDEEKQKFRKYWTEIIEEEMEEKRKEYFETYRVKSLTQQFTSLFSSSPGKLVHIKLTQQHRTDLLEQLKKLKAATPAPPAGDVDATTPETEEAVTGAEGATAEGAASKDAPATEEAANGAAAEEPAPGAGSALQEGGSRRRRLRKSKRRTSRKLVKSNKTVRKSRKSVKSNKQRKVRKSVRKSRKLRKSKVSRRRS